MKSMIVVALALVAVAAALPVEEQSVPIVKSNFDQQPDGAYQFGYESADGSFREETGQVKEVLNEENKPQNVVVVRGSYSYTNPDGVQDTISYEADENGFRAQGPSIPQPPARR